MFKTHLPEDSIWILRFGRISQEEFYNQPIYKRGMLKSNIELISPNKGIIKLKPTNDIVLKFKNLDSENKLLYMIDGEKYSKKPLIKTEGNMSTITIRNPKRNTNLMLYISKNNASDFVNMINFKIQLI